MQTIEIDKNLIIKQIIGKFDYLLSLADAGEVAHLDSALAKVMPALPNKHIGFKIGWKHQENNNVGCGIALFVCPVMPSATSKNIIEKFEEIIKQAKEEDVNLLNMAMDTVMECNPQKIMIGLLPVMEIALDTWAFHFSINTQNQ